jgi:hypothetical protein
MTDLMSFACPHCKAGLKAPYTAAGREARCNHCQKPFIVPAQFEFDEPAPTRSAPAPTGDRPVPVPVFVKPEPKPKPTPSAGSEVAARVGQWAGMLALPVIALAVLGTGAWWFLSGDGAAGEGGDPTEQVVDSTADAERAADAAAAEAKRKAEQERLAKEAETKAAEAATLAADKAGGAKAGGATAELAKTALVAPAAEVAPTIVVAAPAEAAPKAKASIADLVELYGPSVVVVKTDTGNGAGFLAFAPDLVVTNYHVISGARTVTVIFIEGKRTSQHSATVMAVDADNDLALLKLPQPVTAKVLEFAADASVRAGAEVFAIGNPGMGGTILAHTVSSGIVSSTERLLGKQRFLQTTTAINPGNSGGPLFDLEGRVIGVVSAKAIRQENIGFAVPSSLVEACHAERAGKFRVEGEFLAWEGKQPFERLRRHANAIPLKTHVTDMIYDQERDQIIAISPETNKVIFIDLKERKVLREVFTGTDPVDLKLGTKDDLWVANSTSKNLVSLDAATGRIIKTISLQHEPLTFILTRKAIWFMDRSGEAIVVRYAGDGESETGLNIRSLAATGNGAGILCGSATSWLCEFDADKVQTVIARRKAQNKAIEEFNAGSRVATRATEAKRESLVKDLADTEAILHSAIKVYNQPAGTDVDFSTRQQSLFIDEERRRVYFNRCVMNAKDPGRMIGVFKSPEHSLKDNQELKEFLAKYPYLNQIRAVSPDGTIAVSGTHLYNTADFTIIGELPVPTTALIFHPDNKTLYLGDPINRQVVGIEYRIPGGEGAAKP